MSTTHTPVVIFVRHTPGCRYEGDEFAKRCNCRKHLRWRADGQQHRRKANTRSWAQAEIAKRELEDQLSGKAEAETVQIQSVKTISEANAAFMTEKKVEGISDGVLKAYGRLLDQLARYCEARGIYTVRGITREIVTGFIGTWEQLFPSATTRANRRQRLSAFLRFCYESQWLVRIPKLDQRSRSK